MDYGLKISQDGKDVKTCADYELVFSSKFNTLKTKTTGATTGTGTKTIAHSLGYIPFFFVMQKRVGSYTRGGICGDNIINAGTDSTNLTIEPVSPFWVSPAPTNTETFRYYIFYQQGAS